MERCYRNLWIERMLRAIAGMVLILGVLLYFYHSSNWIWFILFVGANLFQSSITNWCPMMTILRWIREPN